MGGIYMYQEWLKKYEEIKLNKENKEQSKN